MPAVRDTKSFNSATEKGPSAKSQWGPGWWLIGLAISVMVLLWLAGDQAKIALRYDRLQILEGEYWRLLSGHWVHHSLRHLALNLFGVVLITLLFLQTYATRRWFWVLGVSIVAIDAGFWWCEPQLMTYVGASGVLHGALAAGAVSWWSQGWSKLKLLVASVSRRDLAAAARAAPSVVLTLALWSILIGKLWSEQAFGASPLAGEMTVIVDAHLYGALGGGAAAIAIELHAVFSRRKAQHAPL